MNALYMAQAKEKGYVNNLSEESIAHGVSEDFMIKNGYVAWREINGVVYAIVPMTFGKGRLLVDVSYHSSEDFYCFPSVERAIDSLFRFEGKADEDFTDWHRHFGTSRRRENGDPSTEYINA